jgi:hypothetical protein
MGAGTGQRALIRVHLFVDIYCMPVPGIPLRSDA